MVDRFTFKLIDFNYHDYLNQNKNKNLVHFSYTNYISNIFNINNLILLTKLIIIIYIIYLLTNYLLSFVFPLF